MRKKIIIENLFLVLEFIERKIKRMKKNVTMQKQILVKIITFLCFRRASVDFTHVYSRTASPGLV